MPHSNSAPPRLDTVLLEQLTDDLAAAQRVSPLTQIEADALVARWQPVIQPRPKHFEPFDLTTDDGATTGVVVPRWLCHLLGLCHRTVHLVLRTPQNWLALQVRGRHVDWPGRLDLSVTGHVRAGLSWQQAIYQEASEELGLDLSPQTQMLTAAGLQTVGAPYRRCEADSLNPPVHICHITQVFTATLTPAGFAALRFADGEVEGLYLCGETELDHLLTTTPERIAPGLAQSWPVYRQLETKLPA